MSLAFVTYCDCKYYPRALSTINDIRSKGDYSGDLILMTDGQFEVSQDVVLKYNLIVKEYPDVDVTSLLEKIKQHPFQNWDGREYTKTKQWNKFWVFDVYFKQWDYIIFVDAGLRIFGPVSNFYPQLIENTLVALDDGHPEFTKKFYTQLELSNTPVVNKLKTIIDLNSSYFLNCIFLFHTSLILENTVTELISLMNEYPISKTNEMAIMNIYFKDHWQPLDIYLPGGKILFDWSERNGRHYTDYISLKYPNTL